MRLDENRDIDDARQGSCIRHDEGHVKAFTSSAGCAIHCALIAKEQYGFAGAEIEALIASGAVVAG